MPFTPAPTRAQPTAPGQRTGWRDDYLLGAVCALVVGFYAWTVAPSKSDWGNIDARGAYYNQLVDGFSTGQLNLKVDVPAGLGELADPYDPTANAVYRTKFHLHDTSFYQGKIFLYYGITPALVLFGPFHWVTGAYLYNKQAAFVFAVLGFVSSVFLLRACRLTYFPAAPGWSVAAGAVALGMANSVPQVLRIPGICEVAIACAYGFAMLACLALWHALHAPVHRQRWLALASTSYGLAIGARPSMLFGAVVFLIPVALAWQASRVRSHARSEVWRSLASAVGPLLVIGIGLALYNYARFGDVLEFGQRYQLAGDRQDTARHFSASYVGFNFRLYFLQWAPWAAIFPFVQEIVVPTPPAGHAIVESAYGILTNTPVALFALGGLLAWRRSAREAQPGLRAMVTALAVLFLTSAGVIGLFYGTVMRYQVEFNPALTLLAGIGILAIETQGNGRPLWRAGWVGALMFSVAFSALTSVRMLAEEYNKQGVILAQDGKTPAAIARLELAVRIKRDLLPAQTNLGVLHLATGNNAVAARAFEAAAALDPNSFETRNGLGRALAALGKPEAAAEQFRVAIRLQPRAGAAHVNLATMLLQLGRPAEAVHHYEIAVELGYDVPGLRETLRTARAAASQDGKRRP